MFPGKTISHGKDETPFLGRSRYLLVCHEVAPEMRGSPSEPACRSGLQTPYAAPVENQVGKR
jgi:hypothetical protein